MKQIQIVNKAESGSDWIDMPDSPDNPCLKCGACCKAYRVSFYQGELEENGGFVKSKKVIKINDFYVAMQGTDSGKTCAELIESVEFGNKCGIYANRPSACREFPVWLADGSVNPKCNAAREKIGLSRL